MFENLQPGQSTTVKWTSEKGVPMEATYIKPIIGPHERNARIALMTAMRAKRDVAKAERKKAMEMYREMAANQPKPPTPGRIAKLRHIELAQMRKAAIDADKAAKARA